MNVFLQTLVCFDGEADKHFIEQCLDFDDRVFVDAVVAFKLKFLKKKWEELVSLANENVMYFLSEDSLLELIKFLISNLEHRCYAVNVFSKSDCYFLCDLQGKRIDDFMLEKQGIYEDGSLLSTLVALNPEKIIVHCNKFEFYAVKSAGCVNFFNSHFSRVFNRNTVNSRAARKGSAYADYILSILGGITASALGFSTARKGK